MSYLIKIKAIQRYHLSIPALLGVITRSLPCTPKCRGGWHWSRGVMKRSPSDFPEQHSRIIRPMREIKTFYQGSESVEIFEIFWFLVGEMMYRKKIHYFQPKGEALRSIPYTPWSNTLYSKEYRVDSIVSHLYYILIYTMVQLYIISSVWCHRKVILYYLYLYCTKLLDETFNKLISIKLRIWLWGLPVF